MSIIGKFTKTGDRFEGTITTLTVNARLSIVPVDRQGDSAPDYGVYAGQAELGAAWSRTSKGDNNPYYSVSLDDPSFTAAINARLVQAEGDSWHLIWSRSK